MKILILGGTQFLGRHLVTAAQASGHEVTIFHRGLTNPALFTGVEELLGDRTGSLELLRGRVWDAVVDTSGYFPHVVDAAVRVLRDAARHYTFISTISVYDDQFLRSQADETAALLPPADDSVRTMSPGHYGPLKAACERVVTDALPQRALIVRPGLLVGPCDPTDRFTWWVRRIARGGKTLAPGNPDRQVQFIDARDVAGWIIKMVEGQNTGVYNATGPLKLLTMKDFLERANIALGANATFCWASEEFLKKNGVGPWMEMPLWLPDTDNASLEFNLEHAFKAGLQTRPLEETVRDTFEWDKTRDQTGMKAGIAFERETGLLDACSGSAAPR